MLSDEQWAELKAGHPAWIERLRNDLQDLARGRCGWAEVLQIPDAELLDLSRMGAARLEHGRLAEAEQTFRVLTQLDPFVPWFWMALGEARGRLGKIAEAVEAYSRCIHEASRIQPPSDVEIRSASLRRGKLYARAGQVEAAYEDFKKVLELDSPSVPDGEQALLAVEALVAEGKLPEQALHALHGPR
jgi:tetratricopeptide (TPR) repeat protein